MVRSPVLISFESKLHGRVDVYCLDIAELFCGIRPSAKTVLQLDRLVPLPSKSGLFEKENQRLDVAVDDASKDAELSDDIPMDDAVFFRRLTKNPRDASRQSIHMLLSPVLSFHR